MKSNLVLIGLTAAAAFAASAARAGQTLSGSWSSSGSVATGNSGTTAISFSVALSPGSAISYVPGGIFNDGPNASSNISLWTDSGLGVSGHQSLQMVYAWDLTPEAQIQPASGDSATITVTIGFSETVLNPVIHFDRLGGNGQTNGSHWFSNSSLWTLESPGVTMLKLSGNSQFHVSGNTIFRTPDADLAPASVTESQIGGQVNPFNNIADGKGTAGGSVQFNGMVDSLSFVLSASGVEGIGSDGIEMVFQTVPLPEPGSAILSLVGAGAIVCWRRRRI